MNVFNCFNFFNLDFIVLIDPAFDDLFYSERQKGQIFLSKKIFGEIGENEFRERVLVFVDAIFNGKNKMHFKINVNLSLS